MQNNLLRNSTSYRYSLLLSCLRPPSISATTTLAFIGLAEASSVHVTSNGVFFSFSSSSVQIILTYIIHTAQIDIGVTVIRQVILVIAVVECAVVGTSVNLAHYTAHYSSK
jgi:hypothetical protein